MQHPAEVAPSTGSSSFAGMLAALAAPAQKRNQGWSDDGLEEDVATLSYERALRTHARYRPADPSDYSLNQAAIPGRGHSHESQPIAALDSGQLAPSQAAAPSSLGDELKNSENPPAAFDRNLKCASITIRLSKAECAQLRRRAAEAGLTVSAYLRSCTFEAESLRALVKDTLAQLRCDPPKGDQTQGNQAKSDRTVRGSARRSWFQRMVEFWPATHASQHVART